MLSSITHLIQKNQKQVQAILIELIAKFLPFALVPFITNAFGQDKYIEYLYYESILFILIMSFTLGQDAAISRSVLLHNKKNTINTQNTAYSITIFVGLICCGFAFFLRQYLIAFISLGAILMSICNMLSLVAIAKSDFSAACSK